MKCLRVHLLFLSLLILLLSGLLAGCACDEDDDDSTGSGQDDDDDDDNDDDQTPDDDDDTDDDDQTEPVCPEEEIERGKEFLVAGNGEAARSIFLAVVAGYPDCTEAHFGVALADQIRFFHLLDELLSMILDPLEEKDAIDVGALVEDFAENLLEPLNDEMIYHLQRCLTDKDFSFELEKLPLKLLTMEVLVYAGRYDRGDVLLQLGEYSMMAAALNTILSVDLHFDFQIVLDHINAWGGMGVFDIFIDVVDMLLDILDDPAFPEFLRLREEGYERMPEAGIQMGYAYQYFHDGIDWIRAEPMGPVHDVTGCSDRNGNSACDPEEFIHGIFYSIPADLHERLQTVDIELRNSYWDGTAYDFDPDNPNPFKLSAFNPVLKYFGFPPLLPPLKIDFGSLYSDPNPDGIQTITKSILTVVRWVLENLLAAKSHFDVEESRSGFATGVPQGPPDPGLDTATNLAALPYSISTARTMQISSHDPTGGNEDGQFPPNHLYIDEHGEFVLFDQFGPGCIYRIQFTHTWSFIANLRIYVDDMETPVAEGPFWMLFYLGAFDPFTRPAIENMFSASGTNFIYIPIPFKERCKITYNVPPEYYGVTFVRYDAETPIVSFTGEEDYSELFSQFQSVGQDPKPAVTTQNDSGSHILAPGESFTFFQVLEPGAIWRLYLDFDPFTQEAVEDLWLVAHWDGCWTPAVEVPLPEFFGSWFIEDAPRALLMGHDGDRFYSYFPMPFFDNGVLKIENRGSLSVEVFWEVDWTTESYAEGAGYFKALYNDENPVPVGADYRIADRANVSGKWIGLTHTMRGPRGGGYMEGDERFYVDGCASPAVHGTGAEDYYNGGWYFIRGPFVHPMCGSPSQHNFPTYGQTGAYRLHIGDAVHYLSGTNLGIEHGADNSGSTEHYSSVSYFYETDDPRLVLTDELDVGDSSSESSHGYTATDSETTDPLTAYYEGEDDETPVTDSGRVVQGASSFTVSVDPDNAGVILRRRYDQEKPRQQAAVLVDGVWVGTWYNPESSKYLRWAEEDFVLPPSLTAAKSEVNIEIQAEGDVPWAEYAYWIFSILP